MSQEHAAAAFHAAKMAQLNVMGQSLDKLPPGLLPPHLDLSKVSSNNSSSHQQNPNNTSPSSDISRIQSTGSVTIEPTNPKVPTSMSSHHHHSSSGGGGGGRDGGGGGGGGGMHDRADIRRGDAEPMDLGYDNPHNMMNDNRGDGGGGVGGRGGGNSSGEEDNYSDDDGEHNS